MKQSKRLLALLLTLLLAFSLGAPAMAEESIEAPALEAQAIRDSDFTITWPENQTIPHGSDFTLSVEVEIHRDNVETAEYIWNCVRVGYYETTEPYFYCAPGGPGYPAPPDKPYLSTQGKYECFLYLIETDNEGNEIARRFVISKTVTITVEAEQEYQPTLWERVVSVLELIIAVIMGIVLFPLAFIITPLTVFLLFLSAACMFLMITPFGFLVMPVLVSLIILAGSIAGFLNFFN